VRKDDVSGYANPRLACEPMIHSHQSLVESYIKHCRSITDIFLSLLDSPKEPLASLHRLEEPFGAHVQFTQNATQPSEAKKSEHTNFGSFAIFLNWFCGLQIRVSHADSDTNTDTETDDDGEW
jgi:hypothetical protein